MCETVTDVSGVQRDLLPAQPIPAATSALLMRLAKVGELIRRISLRQRLEAPLPRNPAGALPANRLVSRPARPISLVRMWTKLAHSPPHNVHCAPTALITDASCGKEPESGPM